MKHQISQRVQNLDLSGIRRVFDLGHKLKNPINFSIGQPDFPVPQNIKAKAIDAIQGDNNSYTPTQGKQDLIDALKKDSEQRNIQFEDLIITSGVSGGLFLAFSALLNPGDEIVLTDPYFLMYKQLAKFLDVKITYVPTYPDFKCTAEKLEPYLNQNVKLFVLNFPGNPTGVGLGHDDWMELIDLLKKYPQMNIISDEIYRLFHYEKDYISPAKFLPNVITLDGFSKSHAATGWRVGWASGPKEIIQQMAKLQQFTFVCSPAPAQAACLEALTTSMSKECNTYAEKRDLIYNLLKDQYEVEKPQGTFYIFPKVPEKYSDATPFIEEAVKQNLLIIPGDVFSERNSHFRISFATDNESLKKGADILNQMT